SAHAVPHVMDEEEDAGMENRQRCTAWRRRRRRGVFSFHVVRARAGVLDVLAARRGPSWPTAYCRAAASTVATLTWHRMVAEPSARHSNGSPVPGTARFSRKAIPPDLAILRGLCHG